MTVFTPTVYRCELNNEEIDTLKEANTILFNLCKEMKERSCEYCIIEDYDGTENLPITDLYCTQIILEKLEMLYGIE